MLGPQGISLLHKLGYKRAFEMTEAELMVLVEADRERRIKQRTLGRVIKAGKEKQPKAPKVEITLESLGFAPNIIEKLRANGQPDSAIIATLRKAGLIK